MDLHRAGEIEQAVARAAALIREARYAVALTGAGVSTPSGIPDFRSPGSGLWEQVNPMEVASIYSFRSNPEAFFSWVRPLAAKLMTAEPNPGHTALAELEGGGRLKAVITQNIDGLHQRAGSREVLELHGHWREATCLSCYCVVHTAEILEGFVTSEEPTLPLCPACGGLLKPNAILFGEQLPSDVVNAAMSHMRRADLVLVAGSYLEVSPASQLPLVVHDQGGGIIVINLLPTYVDELAEVVIHADVADVLPRLARACLGD